MTDLAVFLLACFADDEAVARAAIGKRVDISATWSDTEVSRHIDRWSSARVLAECDAKRRIVELHCSVEIDDDDPYCADDGELPPCPTLRFLALPYADQPGYREEWKP